MSFCTLWNLRVNNNFLSSQIWYNRYWIKYDIWYINIWKIELAIIFIHWVYIRKFINTSTHAEKCELNNFYFAKSTNMTRQICLIFYQCKSFAKRERDNSSTRFINLSRQICYNQRLGNSARNDYNACSLNRYRLCVKMDKNLASQQDINISVKKKVEMALLLDFFRRDAQGHDVVVSSISLSSLTKKDTS